MGVKPTAKQTQHPKSYMYPVPHYIFTWLNRATSVHAGLLCLFREGEDSVCNVGQCFP